MCKKVALVLLIILNTLLISCSMKQRETIEINISVAASLVDPINIIKTEYEKDNNIKINVNSGGSGTLKKQISEGAEVGAFFSANEKYIDELIDEDIISKEDKYTPVENKLVLIKSNSARDDVKTIQNLLHTKGIIAIGEVNTVPAGEYAKEALMNIKIWDSIKEKIVFCKDVTSVKAYVERSEADYGIIYKSDSINMRNSSVVCEIPQQYYNEIVYAMAPIKGYKYEEECRKLVEFINSKKSEEILKEYGFTIKE